MGGGGDREKRERELFPGSRQPEREGRRSVRESGGRAERSLERGSAL